MDVTIYPKGFIDHLDCVSAGLYSPLKQGDFVRAYDGTEWTICWSFLDGFGAIEGFDEDIKNLSNDELPQPKAMLREPYSGLELIALGEHVHLVSPTP